MDSTSSERTTLPREARVRSAKILVAGGFGAGKTTLVGAVSEITPLTTEAVMTTANTVDDTTGLPGKRATTVAMDFGRITMATDLILYLFGTPGQTRFWFMWDELNRGAIGAIVLVDTRRLQDSFPVIDFVESRRVPHLVAVNTFDGAPRYRPEKLRDALTITTDAPLVLRRPPARLGQTHPHRAGPARDAPPPPHTGPHRMNPIEQPRRPEVPSRNPPAAAPPAGQASPAGDARRSATGGSPAQPPTGQPDHRLAGHTRRHGAVCLAATLPNRRRPPRVDALILGVDQVVIAHDPRVARDIEQRHHLPVGSLADLTHWPTTKLACAGLLDYATWLRYAHQTLPEHAVEEWLCDRGSRNQPVVDLLTEAKQAGARLYFLANSISTNRLRDTLAHHDLTGLAQLYCSVDIGHLTPDPDAYAHVLDAEALTPARVLYIDHVPSHVLACRQLGIRAHRYTDVTNLRQALRTAGIRT